MQRVPAFEFGEPAREDVEAILGVTRDVGVFSEEEVATVRELLDESFDLGPERSGYYFVLARDQCGAAGFACYGPRPLTSGTFDLYWIVVAPRAARGGVGGRLLECVVERVRQAGGRLVVAETSGKDEYLAARRFYLGHGFELAATVADFYAPGDDLVLCVLRLQR